jgi:prefoldin beta subunit
MEQIPQDVQHMLAQFQQIQQQAQAMGSQKVQMEVQLREAERAREELAKLPEDAEVYKSVSGLLLKKDKGELEKELADKIEVLELRVKTLQKQEEKIQKRLKEMQEKIQARIRASGPAGAPTAG